MRSRLHPREGVHRPPDCVSAGQRQAVRSTAGWMYGTHGTCRWYRTCRSNAGCGIVEDLLCRIVFSAQMHAAALMATCHGGCTPRCILVSCCKRTGKDGTWQKLSAAAGCTGGCRLSLPGPGHGWQVWVQGRLRAATTPALLVPVVHTLCSVLPNVYMYQSNTERVCHAPHWFCGWTNMQCVSKTATYRCRSRMHGRCRRTGARCT